MMTHADRCLSTLSEKQKAMNRVAISSVAEILVAFAVVVSLIYLASQVRQSNTQARAEDYSHWLTTWNETIKGWCFPTEYRKRAHLLQ